MPGDADIFIPVSPVDLPSGGSSGGSGGGGGRDTFYPGGEPNLGHNPGPHRDDANQTRQHHSNHAHNKHPERQDPNKRPNGLKIDLTTEQLAILIALGVLFLPEGIAAAAVFGMTATEFMVLSEMATLEVWMSPIAMQMAQKAGLFMSAGKALEVCGIFGNPNLKMMPPRIIRLLEKKGLAWVEEKAKEIGIFFNESEACLWAGFKNGVLVSQQFAAANGLRTLEMTPGGAWLNSLRLFAPNSPFDPIEVRELWERVSVYAMQHVKGKVTVIKGVVEEKSIVNREIAALEKRPDVTIQTLDFRPVIHYKKGHHA